MANEKSHGAII